MAKAKKSEQSYTEASESLDEIVERFKSGTLSLEESLSLFEEGIAYVKTCQSQLTDAQGKVEELVKMLQEEGVSVKQSFGDDDYDDDEEDEDED